MKTLITGATGFIGRHLVERIPDAIVAGRSISKLNSIFKENKAREWSGSAKINPNLFDGVDTVYHLAGESIFKGRWNAAKKERIRLSRIEGTRNLVDAIGRAERRPATLICSSAVGYYGSRGDKKLTEHSTPGNDFLAQVCRDWENEALRAEEYGVRVVPVRIGVVLGKDGGALPQMLPIFKLGLGGKLGNGRQYMSWIHLEDLVSIMLHARDHKELRGPVNAVAPNPVTNSDFTKAIAAAVNRPALFPAPGFALKIIMGEFASVILGSQRVFPEVLQETGFSFAYSDINNAMQDLV